MKQITRTATKKCLASAVVISCLMSSMYVHAFQPFAAGNEIVMPSSHKGNKHENFRKMAKYLELSDQQIADIKAIKKKAKEENAHLKETLKLYRESIKGLKDNPVFDEATFQQVYQQNSDNFAAIALAKAKTKHAIYYVLTPEQQQKWDVFKAERKMRRAERRKNKG